MAKSQPGSLNGRSKLNEAQVREIRARYRRGWGGELAKQHGVTKRTINRIVQGELWAWLD